jgi:hypothetical protein
MGVRPAESWQAQAAWQQSGRSATWKCWALMVIGENDAATVVTNTNGALNQPSIMASRHQRPWRGMLA